MHFVKKKVPTSIVKIKKLRHKLEEKSEIRENKMESNTDAKI